MNEQALIELFQNDVFATKAGIKIVEVRPGFARTTLEITTDHLNAGGVTQGGAVFTLADLAMAAAVNAHGRLAFSIQSDIRFLQSSFKGDVLTATATEVSLGNTMANYRVEVINQENIPIAVFDGICFRKKEPFGV